MAARPGRLPEAGNAWPGIPEHSAEHAVVLAINVAVGVATGFALHAIGLERPAARGIAAAVLHWIPYVGSALIGAAAALVACGQFGSLQLALAAGALPIGVAAILGIGVQTWLMGRATWMSAPAVFVSLLVWGMLWGGWGLLLAVPMMVAAKAGHATGRRPPGGPPARISALFRRAAHPAH